MADHQTENKVVFCCLTLLALILAGYLLISWSGEVVSGHQSLIRESQTEADELDYNLSVDPNESDYQDQTETVEDLEPEVQIETTDYGSGDLEAFIPEPTSPATGLESQLPPEELVAEESFYEAAEWSIDEEMVSLDEAVELNGFEATLAKLNTSHKLVATLNKHFSFINQPDQAALLPNEFFQKRTGNQADFSAFSAHVLYEHDFIVFTLAYRYLDQGQEKTNFVTALRDSDLPKYIYYDETGAHLIRYGWSFFDLGRTEGRRLGVEITSYGTVSPQATELVPDKWVKF